MNSSRTIQCKCKNTGCDGGKKQNLRPNCNLTPTTRRESYNQIKNAIIERYYNKTGIKNSGTTKIRIKTKRDKRLCHKYKALYLGGLHRIHALVSKYQIGWS